MYELPPVESLHFLVGQELSQMCVGIHEINLGFEPNCRIYIATDVAVGTSGANPVLLEDVRRQAPALFELLGSSITAVRRWDGGTLELAFSNGTTVALLDTSPHYESYTISQNGTEVVIV